MLVEMVLTITEGGCAKVLGHIHCGAVAAEEDFFVETVGGEVDICSASFVFLADSFVESVHNVLFTFEIGLRFVVNFVERNAHKFVRYVKTIVYPLVHFFPKSHGVGVACLPLLKHLVSLYNRRCFLFGIVFGKTLSHKLFDFVFVMLVKKHVIFSYKVVALHTRRFGSFAVAPFLPSKHRFANMYATVVYKVYLYHIVATGFENARDGITKEVVAKVSKVEWFVGVGRRKF